jgi:hypothetical protein
VTYPEVPEGNPLLKVHCVIKVGLVREHSLGQHLAPMIQGTFHLEFDWGHFAEEQAIKVRVDVCAYLKML